MADQSSTGNIPYDILIGIASNLAFALLQNGAEKIHKFFNGSSNDKMIQKINEAGFLSMMERVAQGLDEVEINNINTIFQDFLANSDVANIFLSVSITGTLPDPEELRNRFTAMGYDIASMPFNFDDAIQAFSIGAAKKAIDEALKPENSYTGPVILGRLLTIVGLLLRHEDNINQTIIELKKLEETFGSIIFHQITGSKEEDANQKILLGEETHNTSSDSLSSINHVSKLQNKLPFDLNENSLFGINERAEELISELRNPNKFIFSVQGDGGIGKTSLANFSLKHFIREDSNYTDLIWVSAKQEYLNEKGIYTTRTKINLDDVLNEIGLKLRKIGFNQLTLKQKVETLSNIFKGEPYIVVIDNLETVEDFKGIYDILEKSANPTKFLITTRHGFPYPINRVEVLQLKDLPPNYSIDLVNYIVQNSKYEISNCDPEKVIEIVGGNPLAINVIVPQMAQLSPDIVLSNVKLGTSEAMFRYIYKNSWSILPKNGKIILQRIMLAGERADWIYLLRKTNLVATELWDTIQNLIDLSLVYSEKQSYFAIHRLLSTFLRTETISWK